MAVTIPKELKEKITQIQDKIRESDIDAKLVEMENLHFTVKFFGETDRIKEIENAMEKAMEAVAGFEIDVAGISAFPSKNYVRVIWLSARKGTEEFKRLCKIIDVYLSKIGFEREKDYVPHLTLARVRSGRSGAELQKLLEKIEKTDIGRMQVKEIKLMKSTLSRKGPVYEEVYCVKLK